MPTKEKLRNTILNKIKKLPEDKLPNLDSYLDDLESHHSSEKSPLSFSGIFEGMELSELTTDLHSSRKDKTKRIPEF